MTQRAVSNFRKVAVDASIGIAVNEEYRYMLNGLNAILAGVRSSGPQVSQSQGILGRR